MSAAPPYSSYAIIKLTDLKPIRCGDKDGLQEAIRNLRQRGIGYVPLRWHESAHTYVQMEVIE